MEKRHANDPGWIGVDFDGTLALHEFPELGPAVPLMLHRVKNWLAAKKNVKIMTAQVAMDGKYGTAEERRKLIQDWCERHGLPRLEVVACKDFNMVELWDDRAIQIIKNTGIRADGM